MKKMALFLALNLIAFTPLVRADFLDLCGSILWHEDSEGFCEMLNNACSGGYYSSETLFDVNLTLGASYGHYAPYQGWTLLMMAAHKGISPIAEAILAAGADVELQNSQGYTAIEIAAAAGHDNIVQLILKHSPHLQPLVDKIAHVVHKIAHDNSGNFLDLCGSILWHENTEGFCEMFNGVCLRNEDDSEIPFDVNLTLGESSGDYAPYQGWTLLMMAAHKGLPEIVEAILKAQANVWLENEQGKKAIDIAKDAGHENIVQLIASYMHPKSLVDQALRVVTSSINAHDDKEAELARVKAIIPVDLHEKLNCKEKTTNS